MLDDDPQTLHYVRGARDPQELSRLVETKRRRSVLFDLMLPGADGIELMQRVPELADLPVIFLSGYGRDETIRALQVGVADYIVKPFSATELTARVQATLRRHGEPEPFRLRELAIHYEHRRVVERAGSRRREAGARLRQEAPPQAGRRPGAAGLHRDRAPVGTAWPGRTTRDGLGGAAARRRTR